MLKVRKFKELRSIELQDTVVTCGNEGDLTNYDSRKLCIQESSPSHIEFPRHDPIASLRLLTSNTVS